MIQMRVGNDDGQQRVEIELRQWRRSPVTEPFERQARIDQYAFPGGGSFDA